SRPPKIDRRTLARRLAAVLLAGPPTAEERAARLDEYLDGRMSRLQAAMLEALDTTFARPYPPGEKALARAIVHNPAIGPMVSALNRRNVSLAAVLDPPAFAPAPAFAGAAVPVLATPGDLATWLGLSTDELTWFADTQDRLAAPAYSGRRHYRTRWIAKRAGGVRLLEAPLPRLKTLQRQILHGILDHVLPHPAAHGFTAGRNCTQAAARHAGEDVVLTADLEDFFHSVHAKRVHAIFRCLGYPAPVARHLTGLVTIRTPAEVIGAESLPWIARRRLDHAHLPQGAPTSPALANLAAFHLDRRLSALMARRGGRYTRYADDLAFSGDRSLFFEGGVPFLEILTEIAAEEGFRLNAAKTRLMRRGTRQRVTGLVVNERVNVPRADYDRLKAILTNCARHGPHSQNRDGHPAFRAHLLGRIAWVAATNPTRGRKLYALFDRIDWSRGATE
ncbi:MAG: reverse transcriptase family protein, partial [Pseudomonadota bacterium]